MRVGHAEKFETQVCSADVGLQTRLRFIRRDVPRAGEVPIFRLARPPAPCAPFGRAWGMENEIKQYGTLRSWTRRLVLEMWDEMASADAARSG